MKSFESTVRIESAIPAWEGVAFTVRRPTEGLRIRLREELAAALESIRDTVAEAAGLEERSKTEPSAVARLRTLADRMDRLQRNSIDRAHVLAGLVKIEGLEINGAPATPATLVESGPPELYLEARDAIRREAGLSDSEIKNSESPITSDAAADGRMNDTTAANAKLADSTLDEIAESTSLAT